MGRNLIETVMGAVVLLVAGGFLAFAYNSSNLKPVEGYTVKAKFEGAGGVSTGSDVRIGGIKIGVVKDMQLDTQTYQAIVVMQIKESVKIPTDSTASIIGDGLLGGKYVSIEPGGEEKMLAEGGEIKFTQSSVSLETLIGKFVFSGGGVEDEEKSSSSSDAPAVPSSLPAVREEAAPSSSEKKPVPDAIPTLGLE